MEAQKMYPSRWFKRDLWFTQLKSKTCQKITLSPSRLRFSFLPRLSPHMGPRGLTCGPLPPPHLNHVLSCGPQRSLSLWVAFCHGRINYLSRRRLSVEFISEAKQRRCWGHGASLLNYSSSASSFRLLSACCLLCSARSQQGQLSVSSPTPGFFLDAKSVSGTPKPPIGKVTVLGGCLEFRLIMWRGSGEGARLHFWMSQHHKNFKIFFPSHSSFGLPECIIYQRLGSCLFAYTLQDVSESDGLEIQG